MSNQQTHKMAGGGPAASRAPVGARQAGSRDRSRPGWRRGLLAIVFVLLVTALGFAGALGFTGWGVINRIYKPLPSPPPERERRHGATARPAAHPGPRRAHVDG